MSTKKLRSSWGGNKHRLCLGSCTHAVYTVYWPGKTSEHLTNTLAEPGQSRVRAESLLTQLAAAAPVGTRYTAMMQLYI